jgi:chemotaxis protein MotB
MSAARAGGRRRRRGGEEHTDDERWLLTYADMITLLMALFMVLFSISSVNTSKFETLQRTLKEAFSGKVLPGGQSVQQAGGSDSTQQAKFEPPVPSIQPITKAEKDAARKDAAEREEEEFRRLKRRLDGYIASRGLHEQVETQIRRRGLVIRLLTDRVLFDSGEAELKPGSRPVLAHISRLLALDRTHPIVVEGHTDDVPIRTARYPSNWELSGARASSVVRFLIGRGVRPARLEASGFAHLHGIAPNSTDAGRFRNRRVEIVLLRLNNAPGQGRPGNESHGGPS